MERVERVERAERVGPTHTSAVQVEEEALGVGVVTGAGV